MIYLILLLCFPFALSETILIPKLLTNTNQEGYCWRDYTGEIPSDAVPGGKDKTGKTTYIGQTAHTNGALIPGQIDTIHKKLFYHLHAVGYEVEKNVKILCSPYPDQFEWIKTDIEGTRFLTQKHLVPGGFDADYPLLIGRANVDDQIVVGKVTIYHKYNGFAYAMPGKAFHQSHYEILSFKQKCTCNVNKSLLLLLAQ